MTISSRTPEGLPNRCPVCGADVRIEPSNPPGDAPCPRCGHLLWFVHQRLADLPEGWSYTRTRLIGRGFGEVWAGEGPGGVPVAIHIVRLPGQDGAQRGQRALELAQRIRHPYLVQTLGSCQLQGDLLIVTELAESSLPDRAEACRQAGLSGVPVAELVRYCREAAEALDYLHGELVIHRDIKPANLFLIQGHAKVGALSLLWSVPQNVLGSSAGTPAYMAPEVFAGKPGPKADQYALAVSYHELRTSRLPFGAEGDLSLIEVMRAHIEGKLDFSPLSPAEQAVIRKATHMKPNQRHANCLEFVKALEGALA